MQDWPEELRPRLSHNVRVRLHRTPGDFADTVVVLHASETGGGGELAVIDGRAWRVLSCCDGTRDLEGIRRAAAARGTHTSVEQLRAFLGPLHAAGCLEDGPAMIGPSPGVEPPPSHPLVGLPGFALQCDGRGSCCRFFATMTFRPQEALRARTLLPEINDAGSHPWEGFTPSCGSASVPWLASAVATRGGRCSYLAHDGGCLLHRQGGAASKPLGCRVFPAVVVDTGDRLLVGPRPECACVFRSGRQQRETVPLVSRPLDAGVVVETLPELIPTGAEPWPRARYRAWAATAEEADHPLDWLDTEARGLGADPERAYEALVALASQHRRPDDLFGRVLGAIGDESVEATEDEAFYLRAVAFAHQWAFDAPPLGEALARRAAVIRLGRRLHLTDDPAGDVPLALAESLARRLGFIGP